MNIFVLTTGRSGSTTFARACSHLTNYTAAHQSKINHLGPDRLRFPANHIEVDNRLSWFLGRIDEVYGERAFYVHLHRDAETTAKSFMARFGTGIISAYYPGIIARNTAFETIDKELDDTLRMRVCLDYVKTVNANIRSFIATRPHSLSIALETPRPDFDNFLDRVGAEGALDRACDEWTVSHNANRPKEGRYVLRPKHRDRIRVRALPRKVYRILKKLPAFIVEA